MAIKCLCILTVVCLTPLPIWYVSCEAEKRKPNVTYVNNLHPIIMRFTAAIAELRRVIKLTLRTNMVSTTLIPTAFNDVSRSSKLLHHTRTA
jgi:hypothetical protein